MLIFLNVLKRCITKLSTLPKIPRIYRKLWSHVDKRKVLLCSSIKQYPKVKQKKLTYHLRCLTVFYQRFYLRNLPHYLRAVRYYPNCDFFFFFLPLGDIILEFCLIIIIFFLKREIIACFSGIFWVLYVGLPLSIFWCGFHI